jgi:uncharacterized protein YdhG (YjbR/CyaY superfamily)
MTPQRKAPKDFNEYIAGFPSAVQEILETTRATIKQAAPAAQETIKYGMPTFTLDGNLVHFAAFKKHIGLFPPVRGDEQFSKAVSVYRGPKGNLKFPLDAPVPYDLIAKVVQLRVKENLERARARKKKG